MIDGGNVLYYGYNSTFFRYFYYTLTNMPDHATYTLTLTDLKNKS